MEEYKSTTLASYEKNAVKFSEKFKGLMDFHRRDEFLKFPTLLPGKKVLDLGAGAGDNALYFHQQGLEVTCVDISPAMVKLCKEKGLYALIMDMENLVFTPESFDGIWAVTSLLHAPKKKLPSVADSIYEILRKEGILYACMKEGDGERFLDDGEGQQRFFAFWQQEEFAEVFKKFKMLEARKSHFGNTVFLEYFFRK